LKKTTQTKGQCMNQVAINDIGTPEDFLRAIDESMREYFVGDIVTGAVVQIDREGVLLDIGCKSEGHIPKKELSAKRIFHPEDIVSIGQVLSATVLAINEEGQYILSTKEAEVEILWNSAEAVWNSEDKLVSGEITRIVKGGMIVDIGLRAFLPASQFYVDKTEDLVNYVGQRVDAKIIQFDRAKGNIVISRRALIENDQKEDKRIQFSKLAIGQVHTGKVSGITNFGVFVSLGLVSGLIHGSKMGKLTPEQFAISNMVQVEIIDIDFDKDRLSLAYKG
jgi:small subunit ribosomal protein S1